MNAAQAPHNRTLEDEVRQALATGQTPAEIVTALSDAPTDAVRDLIAKAVDRDARGLQKFDEEPVHEAWNLLIPTIGGLLFLFGFAAVAWSASLVPWTGTLLFAWRIAAIGVMIAGAMLLGLSTAKRRTRA